MSEAALGELLLTVTFCANLGLAGWMAWQLLRGTPLADEVAGPPSVARSLLGSYSLAIAAACVVGLASPFREQIAAVLFPVQILYSLVTFVAVRDKRSPVLAVNAVVAIVTAVALLSFAS